MSDRDASALLTTPVGRSVLCALLGLRPVEIEDGPDVAAAVTSADLRRLAGCRDRLLLLSAVARVADGTWASADAHTSAAAEALAPVADALVAAPAAQWWWEPLNRTGQRWIGAAGTAPPRREGLTEALRQSMAEEQREDDEAGRDDHRKGRLGRRKRVPSSGWHWSAPLGGTVFTTSGPITSLPAVELACTADSAGEELLEVWAVPADHRARVREIHGPADWALLAADYPRDVTASRHYDWDAWAGRKSTWILPDWLMAARDWDGIHLSIWGWLTTTGTALTIGSVATMLAGWGPDETLWLNDAFTSAEHVMSWRGSPGSDALPQVAPPWLEQRES